MKVFPWLAAALCAGFLVAVLTVHGCAGSCGSNCPLNGVQVGSPDSAELTIPNGGLSWSGPACPSYAPTCVGNGATTNCSYIQIYGASEGDCDLTISFSDRPAEIVHARFGPRISQGCCSGFSIIGPGVLFIPDNPRDGLIYAADGGTDGAVSLVVDASADASNGASDARPDGGADAAPDSLSAD
jgi:hypothetical protein